MDEQSIDLAADPRVRMRPIPAPRPPGGEPNGEARGGPPATEALARIAQLDGRVSRLERLLRGSVSGSESGSEYGSENGSENGDGVSAIAGSTPLETIEPELAELAAAAEYGQSLSRMLVTPTVRAACEQAIAAWEDWQAEHMRAREAAVAASRTIAITASDQDGHLGAVRAFEEARAELAELLAGRQRYLNTANHARAQLAHDQDVRDRYQREIDAGQRAWTTLAARLQLRTAAAVERAEPLPAWLVVSLGPPPPASARWVELAAQLLAYRISYAVGDPIEALGAVPGVDDSPRRRQWHRELEYRLVGWRDSGYG